MSDERASDFLRRRHRGYSGARPDVLRLIPAQPVRVLDVGCGAGLTAKLLKQRYKSVHVTGVELDNALAAIARCEMDSVIEGAIDSTEVSEILAMCRPFDLILCADVMEHLVDPWATLRDLSGRLTHGGYLITSIPNVRHLSTFFSLGLLGTWPQRERGIHDKTHLRFFARRDIIALGSHAGLDMLRERRNLRLLESRSWTIPPAKLLDFWPLRGLFTFQYLHLWRKNV